MPAQRGAEPLAFEAQECNLVEWIHGSQTRVELETVDDPDRIAKPDVLRAQIAMPIDDAAAMHAFNKHVAVPIEKAALDEVDPPDESCRKGKAVTEQDPPVICQTATPIAQVERCRQQYRGHAAIESHERLDQQIELPSLKVVLIDGALERLAFVETAHDDQPIDDGSGAAD